MATITLPIPDELQPVYEWFAARNPGWATALLVAKLRELAERRRADAGQVAVERIAAVPLDALGRAVDSLTELSMEQRTELKNAIGILRKAP